MWTEQSSPTFLVVVALSVVMHVALIASMPPTPATHAPPPAPQIVTVDMITPPPPPPEAPHIEPPAPTETVAARTAPARSPRPVVHRAPPPPASVTTRPPAAAPDVPVELTGTTLSNEGATWSSPTGSGEPITGPIGNAPSAPRVARVKQDGGGARSEHVVAVGDLSRPPKAPDLDAALAANYPADARRAGTTGKAVIRARILSDGRVGTTRVISESAAGFGAACQRTLRGSHWQAPLDAHSQPAMTDISYTCTFAVAH